MIRPYKFRKLFLEQYTIKICQKNRFFESEKFNTQICDVQDGSATSAMFHFAKRVAILFKVTVVDLASVVANLDSTVNFAISASLCQAVSTEGIFNLLFKQKFKNK